MTLLRQYWQTIRYSLWFIPTLIVLLSVVLAVVAIVIDMRIESGALPDWPRVFVGSADGARGTLETIAGAMVSIAALTFSITIVVLSAVAAQYTPRVIRTFMGSTMTKVVLGTFVGIYVYSLVVLRTIDGRDPGFVPSLAVTLALLLAVIGVGFLIAFIHHIASSIQLSSVAAAVADDTIEAIERLFPRAVDDAGVESAQHGADVDVAHWHPVCSEAFGYLQAIESGRLARMAAERGLILRLEKSVGEFVCPGEALASCSVAPNAQLIAEVRRNFAIGRHRTVEQDPGVGIRQLADMALRALSPASNDTSTAIICLDYLSVVLIRLARQRLDSGPDSVDGRRVLLQRCVDFDAFLRLAFEQIRHYAGDNLAVYLRLLRALEAIGGASTHPARQAAVAREAALVITYARAGLQHADQQMQVEQAWQRSWRALQTYDVGQAGRTRNSG